MKLEKETAHILEINRVFNAPRALVFKAWTDPEQAKNWWGCNEFRASHMEMDVRAGGAWRSFLRSVDGKELRLGGVFQEVVAPEKLVFTFRWENGAEGGLSDKATLVTVNFTEKQGRTHMHFRHTRFESEDQRDKHSYGWNSGFERLDGLFSSHRELATGIHSV